LFSVSWVKESVGYRSIPRLYHSGALLIAEGSVVSTGSEEQNYIDVYGDDTTLYPPDPVKKPDCWPYGGNACTNPYEYRIGIFP
jgi:hypothetical protein